MQALVERAPPDVLDKSRSKLAEVETALSKLEKALERLNG